MVVIRAFAPGDAEAISALIRHTMRVSNSRDYPLARLQPLMDYFSPDKVRALNQERLCLVAESDGLVIGTAGLEGAELVTFFVHPDRQGSGIGTRLLAAIEEQARSQGLTRITVDSSLTGVAFYAKMGYLRTGVQYEGTAGTQVGMEKQLGAPNALSLTIRSRMFPRAIRSTPRMSPRGFRQLLPLYLACYVIWLAISALGVWLIFAMRPLLFGLAIRLRLDPWQVQAVDNFSVVTMGLIWLVGILLLEHSLRRDVEKNQLWGRAARAFGIMAAALGLCYALQALMA